MNHSSVKLGFRFSANALIPGRDIGSVVEVVINYVGVARTLFLVLGGEETMEYPSLKANALIETRLESY